jgi:hypothetical protein
MANIVAENIEIETAEYSLLIDGVIECPAGTDSKLFFDGLLDTIVEYVEKHEAMAGLSMTYRPYDDTEEEPE